MKALTTRQQEVYDLVRDHLAQTGMPPTRAEIAQRLGFRSPNAAEEHLKALARKGFIEIVSGASRGIRLLMEEENGLPLIGQVAAGEPLLAQQHIEGHYKVDPSMFKPSADFLLRVSGMSMKDIGILFSTLSLQIDFTTLMWARVLQVIGLPLILIPVASLSFRGLPAEKSNEASAMSTLLRNLGGSIGIAWVMNLLHHRTQLHYGRLGEHITPATIIHSSLISVADSLYQQARMLSYLDIYSVMGIIALLVLWLPLLFRER